MKKYNVSLSHHEVNLINVCLASCASNCFYNGNKELALEYLKLHDKLLYFIADKFLNK